MNATAGTFLEGVKAAIVAMAGLRDAIPAHIAEVMRRMDVSVSDLDNDPVLVATLERDAATKRMIEKDRAKLPTDHDTRRST